MRLQVATEPGHCYRVEQSTNLAGNWLVSPCRIQELSTGPDGVFVGDGRVVICEVPCNPDEGGMFFRVIGRVPAAGREGACNPDEGGMFFRVHDLTVD